MNLPHRANERRDGLSLLEVLIALSIFVAALVGLGQLTTQGRDLAREAQLQTEAAQLCQTKLAEIYAGAALLTAQHDMSFEDAPGWRWDLECEPDTNVPNLWRVEVTVRRPPVSGRPLEVTLNQWLLEPRARGSVFDLAGYDSANSGTSSVSSSAGSSASGGK